MALMDLPTTTPQVKGQESEESEDWACMRTTNTVEAGGEVINNYGYVCRLETLCAQTIQFFKDDRHFCNSTHNVTPFHSDIFSVYNVQFREKSGQGSEK